MKLIPKVICSLFAAVLVANAPAQVVINEFMADNQSAVPWKTAYPDWVELYNPSGQTVDLSNWMLSDDEFAPDKFVFPAGTRIAPLSYLLVWCDGLTNETSGLHASWSLKDSGEAVVLTGSDWVRRDFVQFGVQLPDISAARYPNGTGSFGPASPTPQYANRSLPTGSPDLLRINEWMARPSSGEDWFELYNSGSTIVDMSGLVLSDQTVLPATNRAIPALSFIAAGGFLQVWADEKSGGDHVDFKLGNSGDQITLYAANRTTVIDHVEFFSTQTNNVSMGRQPDGSPNIIYFTAGKATPEASNFEVLTGIVINEVLAHTDLPLEDAVELQNVTAQDIDISYWYLSNSRDDVRKFRIPPNTIIPAGGYKVFYEFAGTTGGFNTNGLGTDRSFTLNSANGDQVYLYNASNNAAGTLLGARASQSFGPTENGVSMGRYTNSQGRVDFVAMSRLTLGTDVTASSPITQINEFRTGAGAANAYPKMGPIVISEIMYRPPPIGTNDNDLDEYVELYNLTAHAAALYDTNKVYIYPGYPAYGSGLTNTWRLRGVVDYDFPTNVSLPPGGSLLVVNFDPVTNTTQLAAFRTKFGVGPTVQIFGPYQGKLQNDGGSVELYKPDPPQAPNRPDAGLVPYILVDRVKYSDTAPWPTSPDGGGASLARVRMEQYANDPTNWIAQAPSPGGQVVTIGTPSLVDGKLAIQFDCLPGASYSVLYKAELSAGNWLVWTNIPASSTTSTTAVTLPITPTGTRFYRLASPAQ